jgi:hypothetical protein
MMRLRGGQIGQYETRQISLPQRTFLPRAMRSPGGRKSRREPWHTLVSLILFGAFRILRMIFRFADQKITTGSLRVCRKRGFLCKLSVIVSGLQRPFHSQLFHPKPCGAWQSNRLAADCPFCHNEFRPRRRFRRTEMRCELVIEPKQVHMLADMLTTWSATSVSTPPRKISRGISQGEFDANIVA